MNNTYLKFHGGIYEFIHPCLLKALFLSSDDLVYYLLLNGSLHDITDFVRSKGYTGMENELFIIVDENYHHILSVRLMRYAFENKQTLQHVAHYIYTYWRITGSELLKRIFTHVEYILYQSLGICTDNLQTIENECCSENEIKEKDQVTFYKKSVR
ncbi:unnamed protein product [Mytilus edulis]|uniref:Uncharacterized protein n=1 Tax=Mytilus edulis TaxID=6550 RepID=A0A8S3STL1_MYTED|nr:unnamed protein product [Mytilus edulis]